MPTYAYPSATHRGRGFTLIELLLVLTIIAISFFAVRPNFVNAIQHAKERTTVRRLVALLTGARTEAVGRGQLVRVVCEREDGVFWAEVQSDPEADRSQFERLPVLGRDRVRLTEDLVVADLIVAGQDTVGLLRSEIYFYPDGRAEGVYLTLLDKVGREFAIELSPATGRVTVDASHT